MKKIAVCLGGCGVFDGAEIHEAVSTIVALDQADAQIVYCAPDVSFDVVDHFKQKPAGEQRSVLAESARIARGDIKNLKDVKAKDIDGLIFPGGFGAAKNLSSFATDGANCSVHPEAERLVGEMLAAKKPVGAICIAPAMLARIVGKKDLHPKMTIGNDPGTADAINKMGCRHVNCAATDMVCDEAHKIVTTPAYMIAKGPAEVFEGIGKLVREVLRLA
ncbi:MAG: isoprenoid biosynthesis glyoxalase ElbB [Planctomycetota bacterium]